MTMIEEKTIEDSKTLAVFMFAYSLLAREIKK